ncbi:U1 small nuclear ribonucleoprotein component Snu71p [Diutina catenulata]
MSPVTTARPYTLSGRPNRVLAKLRHCPDVENTVNIAVPVSAEVDVSSVVSDNSARLAGPLELDFGDSAGAVQGQNSTKTPAINFATEKPQFLVELSELIPKTVHDQVTSVVVTMGAVKPILVEKVVLEIAEGVQGLTWGLSNLSTSRRLAVVKLPTIAAAQAFVGRAKGVEGVDVTFDRQLFTEDDEEKATEVSADDNNLSARVAELLSAPRGQDKPKQELAKEYTVEESELVDVPRAMKPVIVDELISFRLQVLRNENQRRARETAQEQQRAKEKLKEMYERITEESQMEVDVPETIIELPDEHENLDDSQYTSMIERKEREKHEREYAIALAQVEVEEKRACEKLPAELTALRSYEKTVSDVRERWLEELRRLAMAPAHRPVLLPEIVSLYSTNHSLYTKQRQEKRSREEAQDEADREDEAAENAEKQKIDDEPTNAPPEPQAKRPRKEITFNEALSAKIGELLETYVGVADDLLVDMIDTNLRIHGTDGGELLVGELREVLDDDAQTLVDELYEYIRKTD